MSTPNISVKGTIENFQHLGFTNQDALFEGIDNAKDAGASRVRISLVDGLKGPILYTADNGHGMDRSTLRTALCINNTRPPSESIGVRGAGLKAKHICLSQGKTPTRIMTKTSDGDVLEITADWPEALCNNEYNPTPSDLSVKALPIWQDYCLDPDHGTLTEIPLPIEVSDQLVHDITGLCKEIGRVYEESIKGGLEIVLVVNEMEYVPDVSTGLRWDDTPDYFRRDARIEVWRNESEDRVYFEWKGKMMRGSPDGKSDTKIDDYIGLEANGFRKIGDTLTMNVVYRQEWNPVDSSDGGTRLPPEPGYITIRRNCRASRKIPVSMPGRGDYERRRVCAARHVVVNVSHASDDLFGVQVNKSDITPEKIHRLLFEIISKYSEYLASDIYTKSLKKTSNPRNPSNATLKRLLKIIKNHGDDESYLDHMLEASDEYFGFDDDEDE